jgi:hypothetical protein
MAFEHPPHPYVASSLIVRTLLSRFTPIKPKRKTKFVIDRSGDMPYNYPTLMRTYPRKRLARARITDCMVTQSRQNRKQPNNLTLTGVGL